MFSDSSKLDIMDPTKMTPKSFLQSITVFFFRGDEMMHPDCGKGLYLKEGLGCFFVVGREPNRLTHVSWEHFHLTYLDFGMLEDFGETSAGLKVTSWVSSFLKSFTKKNEVGGFSCNLFEEK